MLLQVEHVLILSATNFTRQKVIGTRTSFVGTATLKRIRKRPVSRNVDGAMVLNQTVVSPL